MNFKELEEEASIIDVDPIKQGTIIIDDHVDDRDVESREDDIDTESDLRFQEIYSMYVEMCEFCKESSLLLAEKMDFNTFNRLFY